MATDKLINQTQGADIIDALSDIATNVGNITYGPQTSADKVVSMTGYAKASAEAAISEGDTLNQAIGKLEKKADDNATAVAGKIDKLTTATAGDIATVTATGEIADSAVAIETTLSDSSDAKVPTSKAVGTYVDGKGYAVGVNSSTANNLVTFNGTDGKALKDSGIAVATSSTGLADSDTAVPTSKTVKTYVDSTATGISRYLGTITAASGLSTSAKKGDFYVVKTAWSGVHAGDEIIAEKDSPAQTIDGTNWSLLHNEADTDTKYTFATGDNNGTFKVTPSDTGTAQSVAIKGLGDAAYKGVADTVSTSTNLVTSAAVNTKLASYVPNSDFVVAEQNISYAVDTGVKNLFPINNGIASAAYLNKNGASGEDLIHSIPAGTYILLWTVSSAVSNCGFQIILGNGELTASANRITTTTRYASNETVTYTDEIVIPTDKTATTFVFYVNAAGSVANVMLCPKSIYEQDSSYVPYALPNSDLTVLEAEDRASLAEVVNSGSKNLLDFANLQFQTQGGTTYTKTDTDITVTSSSAWAACTYKMTLPAGNYVFSAKISDLSIGTGGSAKICLDTDQGGHGTRAATLDIAQNGTVFGAFKWDGGTLYIMYYPNYTATSITTTFKASENMICTKAAFGVSSKFVPYRPNWDLVVDTLDRKLNAKTELGSIDMNDVITNCRGTASITANAPVTGYCFVDVIAVGYDVKQQIQKLSSPSTYYIRHRRYQATSPYYSWTSWFKYEGTEVTS